MIDTFKKMPRTLKVVSIFLGFYLYTSLRGLFQTNARYNVLGLMIPVFIYSLIFIIAQSLGLYVIFTKQKWGWKYLLYKEIIPLALSLPSMFQIVFNQSIESTLRNIYLFSFAFSTLIWGLIIYYIFKNKEYFKVEVKKNK